MYECSGNLFENYYHFGGTKITLKSLKYIFDAPFSLSSPSSLSPHHIYPVPPFSFMHMMQILNAASFSQSSYRCVTPPCSANSRGGVCKYIICINQKHYTHTYTHTLLIAPLESYFSHIHNQAL